MHTRGASKNVGDPVYDTQCTYGLASYSKAIKQLRERCNQYKRLHSLFCCFKWWQAGPECLRRMSTHARTDERTTRKHNASGAAVL